MTGTTTARTPITVGELDVRVSGPSDGAPALLLHGFPQSSLCWDEVVPKLTAAGYRTLAPDQRGYSPDARPADRSAYRVRFLVEDALAVVDHQVGPGERFHLVGHDWGAVVAWQLAARHPDRIRSLTALSVPPPAAYARAMLTSRQGLASWYVGAFQFPGLAERVFRPGDRPYSKRFAAAMRRAGQTPERAIRDVTRMAEPGALTAAVNWYRAMSLAGRGGRRGGGGEKVGAGGGNKITVPTSFVWSDGDTAVLRPAAEAAHREVSGPFRFTELRGVSHWIPEEAPDALAALLLEHWESYPD